MELDKGGQRYKLPVIRKVSTSDVKYNMMTTVHSSMVYLKVIKRVNPKELSSQGKTFFFLGIYMR